MAKIMPRYEVYRGFETYKIGSDSALAEATRALRVCDKRDVRILSGLCHDKNASHFWARDNRTGDLLRITVERERRAGENTPGHRNRD